MLAEIYGGPHDGLHIYLEHGSKNKPIKQITWEGQVLELLPGLSAEGEPRYKNMNTTPASIEAELYNGPDDGRRIHVRPRKDGRPPERITWTGQEWRLLPALTKDGKPRYESTQNEMV